MVLTYVFKLKPTRAQYARMAEILEDQRRLYNAALQERREAWSKQRLSISNADQTKSLTAIRKFEPAYGNVPYNLSKWSLGRCDDAMKAFFARAKKKAGKAGFPRFRSKARWNSFGFSQIGGCRLKGDKLLFKGMHGKLKLSMHRDLPKDVILKSAIFTKAGRFWKVALNIQVATLECHANSDSITGVDVGVEWLATTSDGLHYENPSVTKQYAGQLRRTSRALARCQRGSKRRQKVRDRLQRVQSKIRAVRTSRLHEVSSRIARDFDVIAVEKLRLKNMTRSAKGTLAEPGKNIRQKAGLNRALADAAPGRLISMLTYKAERAGGELVKVDPRNTSQECSACGTTVVKVLRDRWHECVCGASLHRDHNAAINIKLRGIAVHAAARGRVEQNVADCSMRALGTTDLLAA